MIYIGTKRVNALGMLTIVLNTLVLYETLYLLLGHICPNCEKFIKKKTRKAAGIMNGSILKL